MVAHLGDEHVAKAYIRIYPAWASNLLLAGLDGVIVMQFLTAAMQVCKQGGV